MKKLYFGLLLFVASGSFNALASFESYSPFETYAPYINYAAKHVDVDPAVLSAIASRETDWRPRPNESGSSADGLFQIKESTYRDILYKHGNKYEGLAMDADLTDLYTQAFVAAIYINQNKQALAKVLGRAPTAGEVYMGHLLGTAGAKRLLSAPTDNLAWEVIGYRKARANKRDFFMVNSRGHERARTVGQFRDYINWKISTKVDHYRERLVGTSLVLNN